ncbi:MAG: serine/threonine-protein kinase [Gemmatimonadaceae bacterium]
MPDPIAVSSDAELRALVERALSAHYDVDREIGRGGMGIVYRAKDKRLKRTVAVKLLPPELAFRSEIKSRFLREAETAAQLSHPNIVPIYSVDEREGLVFFVMACVDGTTLAKRLHDERMLGIEESRRILGEVADALAYAHARGVVHRDIKPDNILLEGDSGRAMVTDFGIARAVQDSSDSRLTATGVAIGTPAFMSPEQAAGDRELDGRSDLYSLGVVAYLMLAGELPFTAATTPAMLVKHLSERPVPVEQHRSEIPGDLATTVMVLLEKEPARRFPSASALSTALHGDGSVIPPRTSSSYYPQASGAGSPADGGNVPGSPWRGMGGLSASQTGGPMASPAAYNVDRWTAPPVQKFRHKFIYYAVVNSVIVITSIFTGVDIIPIPVFWSIYMAYKYAGLVSAGYDWRDVFRQSRDRRLVDVASETIDEVGEIFGRAPKLTAQRQARSVARAAQAPQALSAGTSFEEFGRHVGTVKQAEQSRAEILRLIDSLPKSDRKLVSGVGSAADGLFQRVKSLALGLIDIERADNPGAASLVERQISELESQANPLEHKASEERVRRLAFLKRQRRAIADNVRRAAEAREKLESCAVALQGMRLDVLRLRAGSVAGATDQITLLTERARSLAADVDAVVYAADEVKKISREAR